MTEPGRWAFGTALAFAAGIGGTVFLACGQFLAGAVALAAALFACRRLTAAAHGAAEPPDGLAWLGAGIACLLGVAFRTYRIEPPGLWGDDAINAMLAYAVLDGQIESPFQLVAHAHSHFHALTNYAIAASFRLFGPGLVSLRLPGIVAGILCVPLLYGTLRPLFGAWVAFAAACFFATSPMEVSHAKTLQQVVLGLTFQLAALCLLVQGRARGRSLLVAAAGLPAALCLYTYHSARVAPLVVAVAALVLPAREPGGRDGRRPRLLSNALLPGVFALCALPAVASLLRQPDKLLGRAGTVSVWAEVLATGSLAPLLDSIWRTLLIFHYEQGPTLHHWFGVGTDPASNAIVAFLVLVGLVESLRDWREPRHLLLLTWFAVGILPGLLSTEAPRVYRVLLATPAVFAWAGIGLERLLNSVPLVDSLRAKAWCAAFLVLVVAFVDFNLYFVRTYTHPGFRWGQGTVIVELARQAREFGSGWVVDVFADNFGTRHESLRFLSRAWGLDLRDVRDLRGMLPLREGPRRGHLFVMTPARARALAELRRHYPGVRERTVREPVARSWLWQSAGSPDREGRPLLVLFPVPPEAVPAASP